MNLPIYKMSSIDFSMTREDIEALGFPYAEDENKLSYHMWNWLPLNVDVTDHPEYPLTQVEDDLDYVFKEVLKQDLRGCTVEAIRSVEWTRFFQIGDEWNPKKFTARYNVRILSKDKEETDETSHTRRA